MTYTTDQFLQDLASTDPDQLLSALTDEEMAGMARHALPDMAQELLERRHPIRTKCFSFLRHLLPTQTRAGERSPPPGSPAQPVFPS